MATRTVERTDGVVTERETVRDGAQPVYVERERSGGGAGLILGIALLALVAIVAFFLITQSRNDAVRTEAVTDAASSVADSAGKAAEGVSSAAQQAADNVAPPAE